MYSLYVNINGILWKDTTLFCFDASVVAAFLIFRWNSYSVPNTVIGTVKS